MAGPERGARCAGKRSARWPSPIARCSTARAVRPVARCWPTGASRGFSSDGAGERHLLGGRVRHHRPPRIARTTNAPAPLRAGKAGLMWAPGSGPMASVVGGGGGGGRGRVVTDDVVVGAVVVVVVRKVRAVVGGCATPVVVVVRTVVVDDRGTLVVVVVRGVVVGVVVGAVVGGGEVVVVVPGATLASVGPARDSPASKVTPSAAGGRSRRTGTFTVWTTGGSKARRQRCDSRRAL